MQCDSVQNLTKQRIFFVLKHQGDQSAYDEKQCVQVNVFNLSQLLQTKNSLTCTKHSKMSSFTQSSRKTILQSFKENSNFLKVTSCWSVMTRHLYSKMIIQMTQETIKRKIKQMIDNVQYSL